MTRPEGSVERTYHLLKEMAITYAFKPEARLNEGVLSRQLNTSRTPLREALNRLVAEGFLTFRGGQGFFCRSLSPAEIMDLYEARAAIECEAARLAAMRANPADVLALEAFLSKSQNDYKPGASPAYLLSLDEEFHIRLTALSGNAEMLRLLKNMNARIHYVRLIDLKLLSERNGTEIVTIEPHKLILDAVKRGDADAAKRAMGKHIEHRLEAVTESVRHAFAELYVAQAEVGHE